MTGARRRWVLCVESREEALGRVRAALPRSEFPVGWARTGAEALSLLATTPCDLLLVAYTLPDLNGLYLLERIRIGYPGLPVILLTDRDDEVIELAADRKGFAAALRQSEIGARLETVVRRALAAADREEPGSDEAERTRRVRERAERLNSVLVETMNDGCLLIDGEGIVTFANPAADRLLGVGQTALIGRSVTELFDEAARLRLQPVIAAAAGEVATVAFEAYPRAGPAAGGPALLVSVRSVRRELGPYETCLLVLSDITELVRIRADLRMRLAETERFQRFFLERERRIIELKATVRDYARRLGIESPELSEETRREIERRLGSRAGAQ